MDRNQKFLKRLKSKELSQVEAILLRIQAGKVEGLDVKKLVKYRDVYRVRVGSIRIIFLDTGTYTEVLEVARRSEKTYRDY